MVGTDSNSFDPDAYLVPQMDGALPDMTFAGGDVRAWQADVHAMVCEKLAYPPTPERCELNVRSVWRREHELGTIERIVFRSEPGVDVPAYVCTPNAAEAPHDWFICVQGHSTGMHNSIAVDAEDETKPIEVAGDRDFGLCCLRRGVAALCIEQFGFGERRWPRSEGHGADMCKYTAMHLIMIGRTLVGRRVFDVDRAIDYLLTRDDVDAARIGVMGNSGGGTTSVFAAAVLPRLAFAMPSCYFCTFRDSIMALPHCPCNYVPGLLPHAEMSDVMGLFAPRPVTIVAGQDDAIFPIDAVRRSFEKLQTIYAAAGAPDACRLVVGSEGHRFYADAAWPVMLELMG